MGEDEEMTPDQYVRVNGNWVPATERPVVGEQLFMEIDGELTAIGVDTTSFSVETNSPIEASDSSVTLRGELTELVNVDEVGVYFSWVKAGEDPPIFETNVQTLSSTETFSTTITGLEPGTIYEFWAVAETSHNSVSSGVDTFATEN